MTAQAVLDGMPAPQLKPVRVLLRPVQVDPWVGAGGREMTNELARARAALERIEERGGR